MVTTEDVARAALSAVSTDAGLLQAIKWTSERYREVSNRAKLTHLRRFDELTIPTPVTAGTANVQLGSTTVTGDATSSPLWTTNLVGYHFRSQTGWYEIKAVTPSPTAATLTLKSGYVESNTGPSGYMIVQRYLILDPNIRFLGKFVFARLHRELRNINRTALDIMAPTRIATSGGPLVYADIGVDPETRQRRIEVYPPSTQQEQIIYSFYKIAPDLQIDDPLPNEMDLVLLKAGVLIDVFRYEMSKAARLGQIDKAGLWRNEMRAQNNEWESKILDIIRADHSDEDLTMILRLHKSAGQDSIIMTARDQVAATTGGFGGGYGGDFGWGGGGWGG